MALLCKQKDKDNMQRAAVTQALSMKECHILASLHKMGAELKHW